MYIPKSLIKNVTNIDEQISFYQSLGYNDTVSLVLSAFTYGGPRGWYQKDKHLDFVLSEYRNQSKNTDFVNFAYSLLQSEDYDMRFEEYCNDAENSMAQYSNQAVKGFSGTPKKSIVTKKNKMANLNSSISSEREVSYSAINAMSYSMASPDAACFNNIVMGCRDVIAAVRTDSYAHIEEKGFQLVANIPTSTFRTTYNTAAMSILLSNPNPTHDMVRTEEMLNYLSYNLKQPTEKMFEVTTELVQKNDECLLFCGIQGKKILPSRQNIVLLLDVSGSMGFRNDTTQKIIMSIVSKLKDGDVLSLVTYSDTDTVVLDSVVFDSAKTVSHLVYELLANIHIGGCTYGSAGINKAYKLVERNKIKDGVNRVILITDGDLNFGVQSVGGLTDLILKKKKTGAFLSTIGVGIENLQDDKLEALAKNGNGNYIVCNNEQNVKKCLIDRYESLVYPIAVDVKAQVEFNAQYVEAWELIGYENRTLNHDDFKDDSIIAEPFGSGSYAIAMYRLKMNSQKLGNGSEMPTDLKYQTRIVKNSNEIATISIRYKDIGETTSHEISTPIPYQFTKDHSNTDKAYECYQFAESLRHPKDYDALIDFVKENS